MQFRTLLAPRNAALRMADHAVLTDTGAARGQTLEKESAVADGRNARDPMRRSREAVARAKANEALMKQVGESREAHRRGERGISGRALREEMDRRARQE